VTVHKQGSGYWYYWAAIIAGLVLVIAWFASDGFGLSP
jgi:hypothetical protein